MVVDLEVQMQTVRSRRDDRIYAETSKSPRTLKFRLAVRVHSFHTADL